MKTRFLLATGVLGVLASLTISAAPILAQFRDFRDELPSNLLRPSRSVSGDMIAFCVNTTAVTAEFNRALAAELAATLLVNYTIVEVNPVTPTPPYDFRLPLIEGEIYLFLAHECDAFLGFTQLAEYPDWLSATPPYLTTHTVMAVREDEYSGLDELAPGDGVGTRMLSLADGYLSTYLGARPESERWRRLVYPNNAVLIERLLDGSVEAILIWETAIYRYLADHPEQGNIAILQNLPFSVAPTEFVIAVRRDNSFLNLSLTQAITHLQDTDVIRDLALEYGLIAAED